MIFPVAKANPAKLFVAHFAVHVVAPLVLFDWPSALGVGAVLGVRNYPVYVLAFARVLGLPDGY